MPIFKFILGIITIVASGAIQLFSLIAIPLKVAEGVGIIGPAVTFVSTYLLLAAGIVLITNRYDDFEMDSAFLYLISALPMFYPRAEAAKIGFVVLLVAIALSVDAISKRRNAGSVENI